MFTAFLFTGVFCFYCYVCNGMQSNKVASTALIETDENQELERAGVAKERFAPKAFSEAETLLVSDPWTLTIDEDVAAIASDKYSNQQHQPLLLLPPVVEVDELERVSGSAELKPLQLFAAVDLDRLSLRKARKIAKELGISQKVNGRAQALGFLKSQIKSKLQQWQSLPPKTVEIVRELLAS